MVRPYNEMLLPHEKGRRHKTYLQQCEPQEHADQVQQSQTHEINLNDPITSLGRTRDSDRKRSMIVWNQRRN